MTDGKKHGAGVELQTNGTTYSGEFCDGVASGYGIYVGTLGDKYIGHWHDGARHGAGLCVDAEAVMTTAHFNMDEPELPTSEDSSNNSILSWEEDVQPHVLRAVLAERAAICNQEVARQRHIDAVLQEMTVVGKLPAVWSCCCGCRSCSLIEVSFATSFSFACLSVVCPQDRRRSTLSRPSKRLRPSRSWRRRSSSSIKASRRAQ